MVIVVSAVRCVFYFLKRWRKKIEITHFFIVFIGVRDCFAVLFWVGEVEALLLPIAIGIGLCVGFPQGRDRSCELQMCLHLCDGLIKIVLL